VDVIIFSMANLMNDGIKQIKADRQSGWSVQIPAQKALRICSSLINPVVVRWHHSMHYWVLCCSSRWRPLDGHRTQRPASRGATARPDPAVCTRILGANKQWKAVDAGRTNRRVGGWTGWVDRVELYSSRSAYGTDSEKRSNSMFSLQLHQLFLISSRHRNDHHRRIYPLHYDRCAAAAPPHRRCSLNSSLGNNTNILRDPSILAAVKYSSIKPRRTVINAAHERCHQQQQQQQQQSRRGWSTPAADAWVLMT